MDGYVKIGVDVETQQFEAQIDYIEEQMNEIEYKLKRADMGFEVGDTLKLEAQYEKLGNQLKGLIRKKRDLDSAGLKNIKKSVGKINTALGGTVKKVAKWGLAVFGVRSAYLGIRRVISSVRAENEEIDAQFRAIEVFFTSVFEPLVNRILSAVITMVQWVNALAKAWFGVDLLAKSNEKSLKNAGKNAKALRKELTGFDEMNVLGDDGTTGASGGASFEIEPLPEADVPKWIKWLGENGDLIKDILIGIGTAIVLLKLSDLAVGLGLVEKGITGIQAIGIGVLLIGVKKTIENLIVFIKDPSWNNFSNVLFGISIILAGIALLMSSWILLLVALGVAIVSAVIKNWDKVKEVLGKVGGWIKTNIVDPIWNGLQSLWSGIWTVLKTVGSFIKKWVIDPVVKAFQTIWNTVKSIFGGIYNFFKGVFDKLKDLFIKVGSTIGQAVGSAFKTVINGILKTVESVINTPIKGINKLIGTINKVPGINLGRLNTVSLPRLATGGIINNPGKGVMLGSAIGGEAGAEAVLPLTNETTMSQLGEKIAKYVKIDLTSLVNIDGKTLARIIKKVENENNFMMNR